MKPDFNVVSFSGGKDSTAMLLRMLEEGMQVDMVLFCDTGMEFPQLYAHIKKVSENTGIELTVIKAKNDFDYYFAKWGWALTNSRWCTAALKREPKNKFLNTLRKDYNVIEYIGLAADETKRLERAINKRDCARHPLVDWGMTEQDCLNYCYERGYDWGGLYEHFKRVSCWCCPLQSLDDLRALRTYHPVLWDKLRDYDKRSVYSIRNNCTAEQLEQRFAFEEEWKQVGNTSVRTKKFFKAFNERMEQ